MNYFYFDLNFTGIYCFAHKFTDLSQDFRIIKIHFGFFRISDEMDTTDIEMD